jgi:putative glutathione S-transferase
MGMLVEGIWTSDDAAARNGLRGEFVRTEAIFRQTITKSSGSAFPSEAGRYHLYVSAACPWSHRTTIALAIKGLQSVISVSTVAPQVGSNGWTFTEFAGGDPDPVFGANHLHEVYSATQPNYTGRVTVPVLFDKKTRTIVNNESSEIMRMLNFAFDSLAQNPSVDMYPETLRDEIDATNELIYHAVNNGVYRAGFATAQETYEEAVRNLFHALDRLESRLALDGFLCGGCLTEADWRLFVTLIRFDLVYYSHFKCNIRRLTEYRNLWSHAIRLYQMPDIASTVNFDHIKRHYYLSHSTINPTGIVPVGPDLSPYAPHRFADKETARNPISN